MVSSNTSHSCVSLGLLLLPLVAPHISAKEFVTNGFYNLYIEDVNKPHLCDKLFLVFKSSNIKSYKTIDKLEHDPNYFTTYSTKVKGKWYTVVVLFKPRKVKLEIERLLNCDIAQVAYNTKVSILRYWDVSVDNKLHNALFNNCQLNQTVKAIPEEDIVIADPVLQQLFNEEIESARVAA